MSVTYHIGEFSPSKEDINAYLERFEQFVCCSSNEEVADKRKVSMLITFIGPESYNVLKNLTIPDLPKNKKFDDLTKLLKNHYTPTKLIISERFRFYKRNQNENESISEYILELKKLASTCKFEGHLNDALRDRFVCGLLNENIQQKLLLETKLTFESACTIALNIEMAIKHSKNMVRPSTEVSKISKARNAVNEKNYERSKSQSSSYAKSCSRCGKKGLHSSENCPAKNWTCFSCNKKGHTSVVCKSKSQKPNYVKTVEDDQKSESSSYSSQESLSVNSLSINKFENVNESNPLTVYVKVQGIKIKFEVDSGASVTIIPVKMYKKYFSKISLPPGHYRLNTVNGQKLNVVGQTEVVVSVNDSIEEKLSLIVVNEDIKMPLLGRSWLDKLIPNWRNKIVEIKEIEHEKVDEEFLSQVKTLFPNIMDNKLNT